jgi:hypothetical protein
VPGPQSAPAGPGERPGGRTPSTTGDLLALLDGYPPGRLAPMQRAERDLARARLAAGGDPADKPFCLCWD